MKQIKVIFHTHYYTYFISHLGKFFFVSFSFVWLFGILDSVVKIEITLFHTNIKMPVTNQNSYFYRMCECAHFIHSPFCIFRQVCGIYVQILGKHVKHNCSFFSYTLLIFFSLFLRVSLNWILCVWVTIKINNTLSIYFQLLILIFMLCFPNIKTYFFSFTFKTLF